MALSAFGEPSEGHRDRSGDRIECAKDSFMAGKPLNRLDLRRQREAAEPLDPMEDEQDESEEVVDEEEVAEKKPKKKAKAKAKAPAKAKAKSSRSPKPAARMRVVWVVLNDAFKPVATFDYPHKEAADAKAAELTAKGKGSHFVQRTKEAMPEDAPGLGAALPRAVPPPAKASRAKAAQTPVAVEDDEEAEDEDESEIEVGDDSDDDDG
jgi:hypothetical protein